MFIIIAIGTQIYNVLSKILIYVFILYDLVFWLFLKLLSQNTVISNRTINVLI